MKYLLPGISIILLVLVVGGAAFYLGQKTIKSNIVPPPTLSPTNAANNQITPTLTPMPTQTEKTQVSSGGVLVFAKYTLDLPSGWTSQKEVTQYSDMVTLTKDSSKITIYQAAGGGGGCTYPGEAPQQMAQSFSSFVEVMDPNGFVFRRGANGTPGGFTVCQKNATDGSFGFPTNFGNITIITPQAPDANIMAEIDSILASLKKE
jgi:hypothetical protein